MITRFSYVSNNNVVTVKFYIKNIFIKSYLFLLYFHLIILTDSKSTSLQSIQSAFLLYLKNSILFIYIFIKNLNLLFHISIFCIIIIIKFRNILYISINPFNSIFSKVPSKLITL